MKINQFSPVADVGDAITNQLLLLRDLLRKNGYDSDIYAEYIHEELRDKVKPIDSYRGSADNVLFVHHAMGFDGFERIVALPDKKVLIYHNITPEAFFEDANIKHYIRKGLWQAAEYHKYVVQSVADSNFNRQELLRLGHKNVDVMPIHISVNRFDGIKADKRVLAQMDGKTNILFVGRVVKNKRQEDILRAFDEYRRCYNADSRVIFVGNISDNYTNTLRNTANALGVSDSMVLTGKVSEEALKAYYQSADLFVCMSEHEGFGVPLLEAMAMGVPVMAYRSSAIPETMGGAGVLLNEKDPKKVAALMHNIISDKTARKSLAEKQFERIEKLKDTDTEQILKGIIDRVLHGTRRRTIQMQGPFETSYSLALVNRNLMEALDDIGNDEVSIFCTEGPGDYQPDPRNLVDKQKAAALWEKSEWMTYPDVVIRNMYPPRVADANGGVNFQYFGWEEDRVPATYVDSFNAHLNGIGTMSEFVTRALLKSGITVPVRTIGVGVVLPKDYDTLPAYPLKTEKKIKFLHISSAFPRKGVDLLLQAYFEAFTTTDDVCLVLKTFPNPHNSVRELLGDLQKQYPNAPEVELIDCDLPERALYGLYKAADCYVQSARGEGFGLPVAEAMLAHVPVIVSPNTGMADFCNEETAALVPFTMELAKTHLSTGDSYWATPDTAVLRERMEEFYRLPDAQIVRDRVEKAHELISTEFTWEAVAKRWTSFIDWVEANQQRMSVAMVTTWNNKCGIAEYTRFQCEAMRSTTDFSIFPNCGVNLLREDEPNVQNRVWQNCCNGDMDALTTLLQASPQRIVHFQFQFSFFNLEHLAKTILELHREKQIIITLHRTTDEDGGERVLSLGQIKDELNLCYRLVVHQKEDYERLCKFGIKPEKISIIPLGQISYEPRSRQQVCALLGLNRSLILGSYGFFLPHKGILENIQAVELLKKDYPDILYIVCCAQHEDAMSKQYIDECMLYINRHHLEANVVLVLDYLDMEESMVLLQACDILLMTYQNTRESASGAVRFCTAAQRPLITTQQKIFDEFKDCSLQISECDPSLIASAVQEIKKEEQTEMLFQMKEKCRENSWPVVAKKFDQLYRSAQSECSTI